MSTSIRVVPTAELEAANAVILARFRQFKAIYEDADCRHCAELDVAAVFGWGDATDVFGEYWSNRWLLGDDV